MILNINRLPNPCTSSRQFSWVQNGVLFHNIYSDEPTLSWPSGKGVAAVTSATWVQLTVRGIIYNAWIPGKEVKTPFFYIYSDEMF